MIKTHTVELTGFQVTPTGQVNIEYKIDGGGLRSRTFASVNAYNAEAADLLDDPDVCLLLLMAFFDQRGESTGTLPSAVGQKVTLECEASAGALLAAHTTATEAWLIARRF